MRYMVRLVLCILAAVPAFSGPAQAQGPAFPTRPVRMIVSAAAGGITDIMARLIQEPVGRGLGQPMIVENRVGAGGIIAVDYVAKSAPDGYTLVIVNVSNAAIAPWINKNLPYDPLKDFVGVAAVAEAPTIVAINDKVPVKTLKEFIEYAKKKSRQDQLRFGRQRDGAAPRSRSAVPLDGHQDGPCAVQGRSARLHRSRRRPGSARNDRDRLG